MSSPFQVGVKIIDHGKGVWRTAVVGIFETIDGSVRKIGEYARNHVGWCEETFYPFKQGEQWFALYSPNYTATRVMKLPSCRDIAGEEPHSEGFCPVDYYVPFDHPKVVSAGRGGQFGFVAGTIWGDDYRWKIQYLDLTEISSGVLVRKEMFGYISMPPDLKIEECISLHAYDPPESEVVDLTIESRFSLVSGEKLDVW